MDAAMTKPSPCSHGAYVLVDAEKMLNYKHVRWQMVVSAMDKN